MSRAGKLWRRAKASLFSSKPYRGKAGPLREARLSLLQTDMELRKGTIQMALIKNANAVMTGAFLIATALLAFYLTRKLSTFSDIGVGSGFVPRALAGLQLGFGAVLIYTGFRTDGEPAEPWHLRPWAVLASIGFFAVTIERMGLIVAVSGLVLIACSANRETKPWEAVALAAGAVAFCWIVFVIALGLTFPIWPENFWGN